MGLPLGGHIGLCHTGAGKKTASAEGCKSHTVTSCEEVEGLQTYFLLHFVLQQAVHAIQYLLSLDIMFHHDWDDWSSDWSTTGAKSTCMLSKAAAASKVKLIGCFIRAPSWAAMGQSVVVNVDTNTDCLVIQSSSDHAISLFWLEDAYFWLEDVNN